MSTFLITGCSGGLGLAFVETLAARPNTKVIFATSRSTEPSTALTAVIRDSPCAVKFIQLNPNDTESTFMAARNTASYLASVQADNQGLDVLMNNAATTFDEPEGARGMHGLQEALSSNVVAVHNVTSAFLPLLSAGREKKIVNISSTLGSLTLADSFAFASVPSYKISKAALNMLTRQYALNLKEEGFIVVAVSPGHLRTRIGGDAEMSAREGAEKTLDVVFQLTLEDNGTYRNIFVEGSNLYQGGLIPW